VKTKGSYSFLKLCKASYTLATKWLCGRQNRPSRLRVDRTVDSVDNAVDWTVRVDSLSNRLSTGVEVDKNRPYRLHS